jgi:protein TonB
VLSVESGGAAKPRPVSREPAVYPEGALAADVEGSVTFSFTVPTSGSPCDIQLVEGQPPGVFDRAALLALRRWSFESPRVNGRAAAVSGVPTRMVFNLSDPAQP